jgi:propionyl-CoA synthetase
LPIGLICLYPSSQRAGQDIIAEAIELVRNRVGRVAALNQLVIVDRLPKTRSGKVLRGTVAKIADGTTWTMPATIDDPVILDEITAALKTIGYAGG